MTIENTTDAYGNELTLINMIDDGEKAHHAIPHQNNASDVARDSDYITADEAAELAGEAVLWVYRQSNKGNIETIGRDGKCVFSTVDVEALIVKKENEKGRAI